MELESQDRVSGMGKWCKGSIMPIQPAQMLLEESDEKTLALYSVFWEIAILRAYSGRKPEITLSIKGLSAILKMSQRVIAERVDKLLDLGYIKLGSRINRPGSFSWSYYVLHPSQIEGQKAAIELMGMSPSERRKAPDVKGLYPTGREEENDEDLYDEDKVYD
jgi:hypothetical protein